MDSSLVLLFSLLCKLSDPTVLIPLVSIQLVIVFCLKTREVALPRPGTQPDEDGGTLNCTGASLQSRTRLCLPGKLRASEAAGGEVAAASQRGRLVQGSQPGPALMLGPAALSLRASPGVEPHSLALGGTDCAPSSVPPGTMPPLPLTASAAPALPASRTRPYPDACLPSSTGALPASGRAVLILASFTFPGGSNY